MARKGLVDVKFRGWKKTQDRVDRLSETAPQAMLMALAKLGEIIITDAVKRVPVSTGRLRDSAYVATPDRTGFRKAIEIGFGTDHAVEVHEKTEVPHLTGEAKFLEKAVTSKAKRALWQVADLAEKFFEKGGKPSTTFPTSPKGGQG